jgi:hypothetical protein
MCTTWTSRSASPSRDARPWWGMCGASCCPRVAAPATASRRSGLLDPGALIGGLLEGIAALLRERREAADVRRKETLTQLDGLKWRAFEALAAG